jgi:hypothetical protein
MNGDQQGNEILRVIGSLESSVKSLEKKVDSFDEKFAPVIRTCQSFEDYANDREDLPERITTLEKVADEYIKSKPDQDEQKKYIASLRTTIRACIIAAGLINAVMLALIAIMTWLFHSGYLRIGP